jgi:hypothetical protein
MLVAWWAMVLAAGTLTADAPFWPRLVVLLPAVAILTALGFDRVLDALAFAASRPVGTRGRLLAAAVLLSAVGALNWSWYTARARVYVDAAEWLGRLVAAEPGTRFCLVPDPLSFREEEVLFLAPDSDLREVEAGQVETCIDEGRVIVVYPEQPEILDLVRALSPGAREVAHDFPDGRQGPRFVNVAR